MGNCCRKTHVYFVDINNDSDVIYASTLMKELYNTSDKKKIIKISNEYERLIYKLNTEYNELYFSEQSRIKRNKKYVIDRINLLKDNAIKKNIYLCQYPIDDDEITISYSTIYNNNNNTF